MRFVISALVSIFAGISQITFVAAAATTCDTAQPIITEFRKELFQGTPVKAEDIKCTPALSAKAAKVAEVGILNGEKAALMSIADDIKKAYVLVVMEVVAITNVIKALENPDAKSAEIAKIAVQKWINRDNAMGFGAIINAANKEFGIGVYRSPTGEDALVVGLFKPSEAYVKQLDKEIDEKRTEFLEKFLPPLKNLLETDPEKVDIDALRKMFDDKRAEMAGVQQLVDESQAELEAKWVQKVILPKRALLAAEIETVRNEADQTKRPGLVNRLHSRALGLCFAASPGHYLSLTTENICSAAGYKQMELAELVSCAKDLLKAMPGNIDYSAADKRVGNEAMILQEDFTANREMVYGDKGAMFVPIITVLVHDRCYQESDINVCNFVQKIAKKTDDVANLQNRYMSVIAATKQDIILALAGFEKTKGIQRGLRVRLIEDRVLDYCLMQDPLAYSKLKAEKQAVCDAKTTANSGLSNALKQCGLKTMKDFGVESISEKRADVSTEDKKGFDLSKIIQPSVARAMAVRFCDANKDTSLLQKTFTNVAKKFKASFKENIGHDLQKVKFAIMRSYLRPIILEDLAKKGSINEDTILSNLNIATAIKFKAAENVVKKIRSIGKKTPVPAVDNQTAKKLIAAAFEYCMTVFPYSFTTVTHDNVCKVSKINTEVVRLVKCAKFVGARLISKKTEDDIKRESVEAEMKGKTYVVEIVDYRKYNPNFDFARAFIKYVCYRSLSLKIETWRSLNYIHTKGTGLERNFADFVNDLNGIGTFADETDAQIPTAEDLKFFEKQ